jgi:hypothetical protein
MPILAIFEPGRERLGDTGAGRRNRIVRQRQHKR